MSSKSWLRRLAKPLAIIKNKKKGCKKEPCPASNEILGLVESPEIDILFFSDPLAGENCQSKHFGFPLIIDKLPGGRFGVCGMKAPEKGEKIKKGTPSNKGLWRSCS